jgi:hypothetical protein
MENDEAGGMKRDKKRGEGISGSMKKPAAVFIHASCFPVLSPAVEFAGEQKASDLA